MQVLAARQAALTFCGFCESGRSRCQTGTWGRAPSGLTTCALDALVERSSWWRLTSSKMALMAATISTNSSASVEPQPPNGETTSTHARPAWSHTGGVLACEVLTPRPGARRHAAQAQLSAHLLIPGLQDADAQQERHAPATHSTGPPGLVNNNQDMHTVVHRTTRR